MEIDWQALGARIRAERERTGRSQRELEELSGIPQTTLHRVERGTKTRLDLSAVDALAQALGMRLDHLLYGSPVRGRVLVAARVEAADSANEVYDRAVELLELDEVLDDLVGTDLRQQSRKPDLVVPSTGTPAKRGAALAAAVREHLQAGAAPIVDLAVVLQDLTGVDVGTAPLGSASGACVRDPDRDTSIVLVNSTHVPERQRFTHAHELGHLLWGDGSHVDEADGQRTPEEQRCDEFARQLLIPLEGVKSWMARHHAVETGSEVPERMLASLAHYFQVSPAVAAIQLQKLGYAVELVKGRSSRGLAYKYGWGPQYDQDRDQVSRPRAPQRLQERATVAYQRGLLGVGALARLEGRSEAEVASALSEVAVAPRRKVSSADRLASLLASGGPAR